MTVGAAGGSPANVIPVWIQSQTLKSVPIPGYDPVNHSEALSVLGERLLEDTSIAAGKLSTTLHCLQAEPTMPRSELTERVFNVNSGYTLQILWPLVAIFAGRIPQRVSASTARGYVRWVNRIGRVVLPGLDASQALAVEQVLDAVSDAFTQAGGTASSETAELARGAESASERVGTSEPGIYVFTTPTYLAYPPFGWNTDDLSRQDFRYLKTGSTTVDVQGRIQGEIRRQTGLPEPYLILAKFTGAHEGMDYPAIERQIHVILNAARHGPEEDGTRRAASRGAGTEWFITRLPFVVAVAQSLGLLLSMPDDLKATVNDVLEDCELPDWVLE